MTEHEALMALNAVPGLSGAVLRKLLDAFGSARSILAVDEEALLAEGLTVKQAVNLKHFPKEPFLDQEQGLLRSLGAGVMTINDAVYSPLLKQIVHPPIVLYYKGDPTVLEGSSIAIVGSRQASPYGINAASMFAASFSRAGINVVSGGALGVDAASHRAVLAAKGITIAVLGSGLNRPYPAVHRVLFDEIADKGLVLSEFPLNTDPLVYHFPRRNRIISGLSIATLIIEAGEKSGSLITADYALEQGRDVYALPGPIGSPCSLGTNRLIKDGAKIALKAEDIIEELGILSVSDGLQEEQRVRITEDEAKIYQLIDQTPLHIDIICSRVSCDIGLLMNQMINLELKGLIRQLPGQYYVRTSI